MTTKRKNAKIIIKPMAEFLYKRYLCGVESLTKAACPLS